MASALAARPAVACHSVVTDMKQRNCCVLTQRFLARQKQAT